MNNSLLAIIVVAIVGIGGALVVSSYFTESFADKQVEIKIDQNIRIEDSTFNRQSLQTGETITELGSLTSIIIESLGSILIVFFIIVYAIKKRFVKKDTKESEK